MGLFSRRSATRDLGSLGDDRDFETAVVGESFYRDDIISWLEAQEHVDWKRGRRRDVFFLVREPDNPHDPNAIRVATYDGVTVGYLPADLAAEWSPRLADEDRPVRCVGAVGWDRKRARPTHRNRIPVGVRLDLLDQR